MRLYSRNIPDGIEYSAYINVGGGLASIGSGQNLVLVPEGLTKNLPIQNYPRKGAMILFGEMGLPIINIVNVLDLIQEYGLPESPEPLPTPPSGGVFYRQQYNLYAVVGALVVYIGLLVFIISRKDKGTK
jgi:hypothetical protein